MENAKKGGTHFVNETGQSASAGPARAACDMLRCIIRGESEVQPVVAVIQEEYNLLKKEDNDGRDNCNDSWNVGRWMVLAKLQSFF